jgi:hypothetical protein
VRAFDITYPACSTPTAASCWFGTQLPAQRDPVHDRGGRQGRVAARVLGEVTEATIRGLVDDVAAGK